MLHCKDIYPDEAKVDAVNFIRRQAMAKHNETKKALMEIFKEREEKWYSISELEEICKEDYGLNFDDKKEKNNLYNQLYRFKQDGIIICNRSLYRINDRKIDNALQIIEDKIESYKNLKWYSCSDEELEEARSTLQRITDLSSKVQHLINRINDNTIKVTEDIKE